MSDLRKPRRLCTQTGTPTISHSAAGRSARRSVTRTVVGAEPEDLSPARDPERATINRHLRAAIRTALQRLAEPYRTAVILRDVEGLPQEEIAANMECALGTAK